MKPNEQLEEWIDARGIKKSFFAKQIGVSPSAMTTWLAGRRIPNGPARIVIEAKTGIPADSWGGE